MKIRAFTYLIIGSFGINAFSCKPRKEASASLESEEGASGPACPLIDVTEVFKTDRAKAVRIMTFLYRMMLRGNTRAASLFFAAIEGVPFSEYMRQVNSSVGQGKLLAANSSGDMDKDIMEDVEATVMKDILISMESGKSVKLASNNIDMATVARRYGEVVKQSLSSDQNLKAEIEKEFATIVEAIFDVEASEAETSAARTRSAIQLDLAMDAAREAGLESSAKDSNGLAIRTNVVNDMVFTKAYIGSMTKMADSMLNSSGKSQINKFDFFYKDFVRLAGAGVLDNSGLRELGEILRKDPNSAEYKKLQSEGKLTVGGKEVSLNDITNAEGVISKLKASGRGDAIIAKLREVYVKEKAGK